VGALKKERRGEKRRKEKGERRKEKGERNKHNNQQAPLQNPTAKSTGTSKKQRVPPLSGSLKSRMMIIGLDGGMVDAAVSKTVVRKDM
jgi:hypothetical protein